MEARDLDTFFYQDRAAHLASCQLPLIVALAGKNNIISCKSATCRVRDVLLSRTLQSSLELGMKRSIYLYRNEFIVLTSTTLVS